MKIVIDIDDEIAQGIIEGSNDEPRNIVRSFQATIADAIKKGIPLPMGHGRLIDLNDLYDFDRRKVEYAPTIIEADKAESEVRNESNN